MVTFPIGMERASPMESVFDVTAALTNILPVPVVAV